MYIEVIEISTTIKNTIPIFAAIEIPTYAIKVRKHNTHVPSILISLNRSPVIGFYPIDVRSASTAPRIYIAPANVVPR